MPKFNADTYQYEMTAGEIATAKALMPLYLTAPHSELAWVIARLEAVLESRGDFRFKLRAPPILIEGEQ